MKNNKIYVVLLVIIVVFFVIMFTVFGIDNIRQDNYSTVLIVGDNTTWTYQDRSWFYMRSNSSMSTFNWQKFHVYSNNIEFGDYYLWHDDKWYAFDDNKKAVNIDGNFLAYQANYNLKVSSFTEEEVSDFKYVNEVLLDNDLSISSKFSSIYKVNFDFDNDSVMEDFYVISNVFAMDFEPDKIFSIAFMEKNQKIYYIFRDVSANNSFNGCKPYYYSFLDINNDNTYEFILSCGKYSASEQVDMLYQFKDEEFKILISNQ